MSFQAPEPLLVPEHRFHADRCVQVHVQQRHGSTEAAWGHADYRQAVSVDAECPPDDVGASAIVASPEAVTDDCHRRLTWHVFPGNEAASQLCLDTEHVEEVGSDVQPEGRLGILARAHGELPQRVGGCSLEGARVVAVVGKARIGEAADALVVALDQAE